MANMKKSGKEEGRAASAIRSFYEGSFDRIKEENERDALEWRYRKPDTDSYRLYNKFFIATVVAAVLCFILSFATGSMPDRRIPYALLVAALAFCIIACILMFGPMHKERMRYAAEMEAKRKKAEKKAARAARRH